MPKLVAALLAVLLAAAVLAACGGGSNSDTGSTAGEAASQGEREAAKEKIEAKLKELKEKQHAKTGSKAQDGGGSGSSGSSSGGSSDSKRESVATPLKVSGGGSAQFRVKGGDNSIQNFGEESDESELQQAAETLHAFYVARAEEDWARACSYLAKQTAKQLEQLASRSPQLKDAGCAAVLEALTRPLPPSVDREITQIDAGSLRREGERSFLIYSGAGGKTYAISMQQEGGAWKVGALAATPLS